MKIVSWNCNGALRNKFSLLDALHADLYIIQECENPELSNNENYKKWASNHLWTGDSKNRGVGIFAKNSTILAPLNWSNLYDDHSVKHFLPCLINNKLQLVGIWTSQGHLKKYSYIGQFWKFLEINKNNFKEVILVGDLNSNAIWDKKGRHWNHSEVVNNLRGIKIESLYHKHFNELHGKETKPTFFLHRNIDKAYHIDYIFASVQITKKVTEFDVKTDEIWLKNSDHLPITCKF